MLRLESIVLQGFKSFVDRTKLSFPLGISCIVGPNGCGKSNIADAIAWVLGEQSPKSLRGQKMGDVIFAGSPARTASGHADVCMNWVREEPGKKAKRLEVGRKLYRNGDSEYILNGKICRLRDVQGALFDFGMGTKTYSIIEQGKIGQILSSKPTERRQLLEEAAGILKYKIRRHESQLKLRSAEENLQRLQDILLEIQKQRNYLKRQVGKARRYKMHKERLREIERHILSFEIHHFSEKHRKLQSEYRQLNREEQEASRQLNRLEEALRKTRESIQRDEEKHKQQIRSTNETAKEIERLKQRIHFFKDKIQERNNNLASLKTDTVKGDEHIQSLEEDLALRKKDVHHVEETLKQQKAELEKLVSRLSKEKAKLSETAKREEALRSDLEGTKKRLHGLEIEATQIVRQKSLLENQLEVYQRGKKEMQADFDKWTQEQETLGEKQRQTQAKLSEKQVFSTKSEQALRKLKENQSQIRSHHTNLEKQVHRIGNQLGNLENLYRQRQDLSDSVRWVIKKTKGNIPVLRDFLDSDHQYDTEIEMLLGDLAQAFLLTSDEDENLLLPLMRKKRVLVLDLRKAPQEPANPSRPEGAIPVNQLLKVVKESPRRKNLQQTIRSLLANCIILPVQDKEDTGLLQQTAVQFPHLTIASPGNQNLFQANLIQTSQRGARGFLTLKGEIKALKRESGEIKQQFKQSQNQLQQINDRVTTEEKQLKEVVEACSSLKSQLDQLQTRREHLDNMLVQLNARRERDERRAVQLLESQKQIQTRNDSITKERQSLNEAIGLLEADMSAQLETTRSMREHVQEHFNLEARLKEKIDAAGILKHRIQEEYQQLEHLLKAQKSNEQARAQQLKTIQKELVDFQASLLDHESQLSNHQKKFQAEEHHSSTMESNLQQNRSDIEARDKQVNNQRDMRDDMRAKQGRFELEQARIQSELKHLKESYTLSQNEPYCAVNPDELLAEETIEVQKAERTDIKRKLSELGTVNLLAVEEYDEVEERYAFLINQQKDLVDSIAEIRSTIKKLNKESISRFKEAFEEINHIFQRNFVTLFGGGNARLELLDEDHVLDSGIDMIIQPPGKKLQNAMLMSGGEKALTATALLFSIFEYKPSPFCLLDEVDAPLDEANVVRLTKKLEEMAQQTQFIMITHHKSTMSIASSLFGVTMEENGCSKIVSVNFN
ncbi:MAG: chromosome segregation protein SMC [Acidobacteria bacterium]|nr:MAG: chromosome segregation protein SMC [Acidobacteriota bacterium]